MFRPSDLVANIANIANPGLGYQRRPQERLAKLRKMAAKFNPALLGLFHAWINADGLPECLDGLGRLFVLLHLLNPSWDEPVLVAIHTDVTNTKQAAIRFCELNPDEVTKVSDKHKYLSRLTQGDWNSVEIQTEAELGKLVVGGSGRNGISVQAAIALHHMRMLSTVGLLKVNGEWHGRLSNPYFVGLGGYLIATDDNSVVLREFLKSTSVQTVEKEMHDVYDASTPHARITAARFARVLFKLRNHRKAAHNRVTADWGRVDTIMSQPPFCDRWSALG
jgi:hypothetical protein